MTIVDAPPDRITPEAFLSLPDDTGSELVDGQIVERHVSIDSAEVENWIAFRLTSFVDQNPVARVFSSGLIYRCFQNVESDPDRMRRPDATIIRIERINELSDPHSGYMPIYPDLAVEVLSKNDTLHDTATKLREYRSAGFPLIWVVDPDEQTVTVHKRGGKPALLSDDDVISAEQALPGFACKVSELFPPSLLPKPSR